MTHEDLNNHQIPVNEMFIKNMAYVCGLSPGDHVSIQVPEEADDTATPATGEDGDSIPAKNHNVATPAAE
jgi:hypothetical protein